MTYISMLKKAVQFRFKDIILLKMICGIRKEIMNEDRK